MRRAAAIPRPADQRDTGLDDAELRERLAYTWGRRPGIIGWLSTVDHKEIGRRYIITAFVFLALGGLLAAIIRLQLARPEVACRRPRPLQSDFHDARLEHDVPVRRAGHAGFLALSRAADGGDAQHRLRAGSVPTVTGCFSPAACFCGCRSSSTSGRTSAGLPTCRSRARNTASANALTCGRR